MAFLRSDRLAEHGTAPGSATHMGRVIGLGKPGARMSRGSVTGLALALLMVASILAPALAGATYQKIRVPYPDPSQRSQLFFHPDLELMGDDDGALLLLSRPDLTAELQKRGFDVQIVVPDLEAAYAARAGVLRDYGRWHTYAEAVAEMNLIHSQYPSLTTAPSSIGTTGEGRTVWAMKVSDNPNVQESEPEVYFDGVHHAREPITLEDLLYFIRYLCENYGTDPVITFLVDNRQIWFVPIVNVDGYVYNELTNPNGGGYWRKNRRNNGGCYGVDPNRNYPYEWVGSGSSTDPCDDTYRGPSAGSEPEIQAVMNLINTHHFVISQSYHSNSEQILIPWAYTTTHTPDDAALRAIANEMRRDNGYTVGQPPEILYNVNGGSLDWHYGATTEHPKIFAFTTEIGGSDFWPAQSEIDGLIAENLHSDIYVCQVAGPIVELAATQVTGGDGNGRLDPGESASLVISVRNPSVVAAATNVRATLICQDPYVSLSDASSSLGTIAPGATTTSSLDPFAVTVDAGCPPGRSVNFIVRIEADGGVLVNQTAPLTVGQLPVVYADDFESAGGAWLSDPSSTATTGAFVRIDPVATTFQPGDDATPGTGAYAWITAQNPTGDPGIDDVDNGMSATRSPVIDLSGVAHAELNMNYFHGQRDSGDDPTGDFFRIDVSNDGGTSFPVNLVLIGDVMSTADWRNLRVNLDEYLPLTANMVIRVQAQDGTGSTGMADVIEAGVDDVNFYDRGVGNEPPSAPTQVSPLNGAQNQLPNVALVLDNATDPEGDALTYGFRVYSDALLTHLVASVDGVVEGSGGTTTWHVNPPLAQGTYYWRAYAADPNARGLYTPASSFGVTSSVAVADGSNLSQVILSAGPNPARGQVHIRYYTPSTPIASLEIFDAAGRMVRTLPGVRWTEGWQEVVWDGKTETGSVASAGVYWVRLALPGETRSVRVVQVR
jgi:hypothetical protein